MRRERKFKILIKLVILITCLSVLSMSVIESLIESKVYASAYSDEVSRIKKEYNKKLAEIEARYMNAMSDNKIELQNIATVVDNSNGVIEELNNMISVLSDSGNTADNNAEIQDLENNVIPTLNTKKDNLETQLLTQSEEVTRVESEVGALESEINSLTRKINKLNSQITILDGQIASLDSQIYSLSSQIDSLQEQYDALDSDSPEAEAILAQIEDLQTEKGNRESERNTKAGERNNKVSERNGYQTTKDGKVAEKAVKDTEFDAIKAEYGRVQEELIATQNEISEKNSKLESLKLGIYQALINIADRIDSYVNALNGTNRAVDLSNTAPIVTSLRGANTDAARQNAINDAKGKINQIKNDINSITNSLTDINARKAEIENEISEIEEKKREEINQLKEETDAQLEAIYAELAGTGDVKEASIALTANETKKTENTGIASYSGSASGGAIYYEDLTGKQYILCRAHHGILRTRAPGYWEKFGGKYIPELRIVVGGVENAPSITEEGFRGINVSDIKDATNIYTIGPVNYSSEGINSATPMEAYVLAHVGEKSGHPDEVQNAWWSTYISYNSNMQDQLTYVDCGLTNQAKNFEAYIKKVTKQDAPQDPECDGFDIPAPKWGDGSKSVGGTNYNFEKVEIKCVGENGGHFDYEAGPFSLDYVRAQYGGVDFGVIEELLLVTDNYQDGIELSDANKDKWEILLLDGTRISDVSEVPGDKTPFKILIHYDSGIVEKKVLNIKAKIKYMNGCGQYQKLRGFYTYNRYQLGWSFLLLMMVYNQNVRITEHTMHAYMEHVTANIVARYNSASVTHHELYHKHGDGNLYEKGTDNMELYGSYGDYAVYRKTNDEHDGTDYDRFNKLDCVEVKKGTAAEAYYSSSENWSEMIYGNSGPYTNPYDFNYQSVKSVEATFGNGFGMVDPYKSGVAMSQNGVRDGNISVVSMTGLYVFGESNDSEIQARGFAEASHYGIGTPDLAKTYLILSYLGSGSQEWQALNAAIKGELWYQHYELDLIPVINDTQLKIKKVYNDPNGVPIDEDIAFDLEVDNSKTITNYGLSRLSVNATNTRPTSSWVYYYQNNGGGDGLGFTLTEISDHRIVDVKATGTKGNGESVSWSGNTITGTMHQNILELEIKNEDKKPVNGKFEIQKISKMSNTYPNDSKTLSSQNEEKDPNNKNYYIVNEPFPFLVTISPGEKSSFKYNGKTYIDPQIEELFKKENPGTPYELGDCVFITSVNSHGELEPADESKGQIKRIENIEWWDGTKCPTYQVREINNNDITEHIGDYSNIEGSELLNDERIQKSVKSSKVIDINNETGEVKKDDEAIIAIGINEQSKKSGKIRIVKRLDLSSYLNNGLSSEQAIELINKKIEEGKLQFSFDIKIGNEDSFVVNLADGGYIEEKSGSDTVALLFEWVSEEKTWLAGNELPYTVVEIVSGENQIQSADGYVRTGVFEDGKTILVKSEGESDSYSFNNKVTSKQFKIKITKRMDPPTAKKLTGKKLHFVVNLQGEFAYSDASIAFGEHRKRLTNSGSGALDLVDVVDSLELSSQYAEMNDDEKYITFEVPETYTGDEITVWESGFITYFPEDKLEIMVYEEESNLDSMTEATMIEGISKYEWVSVEKLDFGEDNSKNILTVKYKNEEIDNKWKTGFLRINKKTSGVSELTEKQKDELKFYFDVIVLQRKLDSGEWTVVKNMTGKNKLEINSRHRDGDEWNWVDPDAISWNPEEYETPVYVVIEDMGKVNPSITFDSIRCGGYAEIVEDNHELFKNIGSNVSADQVFAEVNDGAFAVLDEKRLICPSKYAVIGRITPKDSVEGKKEPEEGATPIESSTDEMSGVDETTDTVDVYFRNTFGTINNSGRIRLQKLITNQTYDSKSYGFVIKITEGKFTLKGNKEYELGSGSGDDLYLTANNTLVKNRNDLFVNGKLNPDMAIIVNVPKNSTQSSTWKSEWFTWKSGDAPPKYEIEAVEFVRDMVTDTVHSYFEPFTESFSISSKDGEIVVPGTPGDGRPTRSGLTGEINDELLVRFENPKNTIGSNVRLSVLKEYDATAEFDSLNSAINDMYSKANTETDAEKKQEYIDEAKRLESVKIARDEELKNQRFLFYGNMKKHGYCNFIAVYSASDSTRYGVYKYRSNVWTRNIEADDIVEYEVTEGSSKDFEIDKFVANGTSQQTISDGKAIRGFLSAGGAANVNGTGLVAEQNSEVRAVNKLREQDNSKLQITKVNTGANEIPINSNKTYKFNIKVMTPDNCNMDIYGKYVNGSNIVKLLKGHTYYYTTVNGVETLTEEANSTIDIPLNGNASKIWNSKGTIYWYTKSSPRYEVTEPGENPRYNGSNKGTFGEYDENKIVKVFVDNTTTRGDKVHLKINKSYTGSINSVKRFAFKVEVEGYADRIVELTTNGANSSASETLEYELKGDKKSLNYTVTEIRTADSTSFKRIYEEGDPNYVSMDKNRSISGILSKGKTISVVCEDGDGGTDSNADLYIKKEGVSKGIYRFKVRIDASADVRIVNGQIGRETIEKGKSGEYYVNVNAGSTVLVGSFKWIGTSSEAPTYMVEEVTDETGNVIIGKDAADDNKYTSLSKKVKVVNPAGKLSSNQATLVKQINEPVMTYGYIKVTKKINGTLYNKDKDYHFNVFVYDLIDHNRPELGYELIKEYKNQSVKAGEVWTSDKIEWEKWNEEPRYYIEEIDNEDFVSTSAPYTGFSSMNKVVERYSYTTNDVGGIASNDDERLSVPRGDEEFNTNRVDYIYGDLQSIDPGLKDVDDITNEASNYRKGKVKIRKEVEVDKAGVPESSFKMKVKITGIFKENPDDETTKEDYTANITLSHGQTWEKTLYWADGVSAPKVYVEETNLNSLNRSLDKGNWSLAAISNNGAGLIENGTIELVVHNRYNIDDTMKVLFEIGGNIWIDCPEDAKNVEADGIMDPKKEKMVKNAEVYVYRSDNNELMDIYTREGGKINQPILTDANGRWDASIWLDSLGDITRNKFYVVYVYDGQTYEPTKLLATGRGYTSSGASSRDNWKNDSMALEVKTGSGGSIFGKYNRKTANEKMATIEGDTPIDGKGRTIGKAIGVDKKETKLTYDSDRTKGQYTTNGSIVSRVKSRVVTLNEDGTVKEPFKVAASTKEAGLIYPFDNKINLTNKDDGEYKAAYEYAKHINLGLKARPKADLLAVKELKEAIVYVKGRELKYTFNSLANVVMYSPTEIYVDYEKDSKDYSYNQEASNMLCYTLGLFKTDYYYRAELYKEGANYDKLYKFYKNLGLGVDSTEMEVFLTYRYLFYNGSEDYNALLYRFDDYADSSLELVTEDVKRYVKSVDDIEETASGANKLKTIVNMNDNNQNTLVNKNARVSTTDRDKMEEINGSDGYTYNKLTFDFGESGVSLSSGQTREYVATFKVRKGNYDSIADSIILGTKSNIVEIASYRTLNPDNSIAGRIDRNSAPSNVNIREYNTEGRYEDDTYITRVNLRIDKDHAENRISGRAWEDKKEDDSSNGDGLYANGQEALIGGLPVELVEKIQIPNENNNNIYTEYDFLWPTDTPLGIFGGKTLEFLTGFDSKVETLRKEETCEELTEENGNFVYNVTTYAPGSYRFVSVPFGNYIVRFRYGSDESIDEPMAIDKEGNQWSTSKNGTGTYTANYYNRKYGLTPAIYNGQDYKATIYQAEFGKLDQEFYDQGVPKGTDVSAGTIDEEGEIDDITTAFVGDSGEEPMATYQHEFNMGDENIGYYTQNHQLAEIDSNARDNEARRLEVMANSEIITNGNASDMNEANKASGKHYKIHNYYEMFADSPKIAVSSYKATLRDTDIEPRASDGKATCTQIPRRNEIGYVNETQYVDIGLVERPENKIILDKQISGIRLTTNDNKLLFNAVYDLDYEIRKVKYNINTEKDDDSEFTADRSKLTIIDRSDPYTYTGGGTWYRDYIVAKNILNKNKSTGIEMMQSLDKVESKLEYIDEVNEGIQNFRFINIDNDILQGLNVELNYKITAINAGEADFTHKTLEYNSGKKASAAEWMIAYSKAINKFNKTDNAGNDVYSINQVRNHDTKTLIFGDYSQAKVLNIIKPSDGEIQIEDGFGIGQFYYTGMRGSKDLPVSTRIRQVLDYVDNDAVFETDSNKGKDHYWRNVTVSELDGNGAMANRLIDLLAGNSTYILDKDARRYVTDTQNNLAISVDTVTNSGDNDPNKHDNGGFEMKLLPISYEKGMGYVYKKGDTDNIKLNIAKDANGEELSVEKMREEDKKYETEGNAATKKELEKSINRRYKIASVIDITVLKRTASDDDADVMAYDNLTEIVKYENSVGRRDMAVVSGNAKPRMGEFITSLDERDTSATELITFTPPTGVYHEEVMHNQMLIAISAGIMIIVGGIIVIKKKVLPSKYIK